MPFPTVLRIAQPGEGTPLRDLKKMPKAPINHRTVEAEQFAWLLKERLRLPANDEVDAARKIMLRLRSQVLRKVFAGGVVTNTLMVARFAQILVLLDDEDNIVRKSTPVIWGEARLEDAEMLLTGK